MTAGQWFGVVLILAGLGAIALTFVRLDDLGYWFIATFLLGVALVVFGCMKTFDDNPHHLREGYVVGRKFTSAHTQWTTQCISTGKTTVCHPQPIFVGDDWTLKLRQCDVDRRCVNGTLHFDDSTAFDTYEVGDYYPAGVR